MKKLLLTTAVYVSILAAQPAISSDNIKPYIGLEYQNINTNFESVRELEYNKVYADNYHAIAPYVGARIGNHLGFELGYSKSFDSKDVTLVGNQYTHVRTNLSSITLDSMFYMPVNESKTIELIGSTGIGIYQVELEGAGVDDVETNAGFRLGGGLQHSYGNLTIRTMVRYNAINSPIIEDATSYNVGVGYSF